MNHTNTDNNHPGHLTTTRRATLTATTAAAATLLSLIPYTNTLIIYNTPTTALTTQTNNTNNNPHNNTTPTPLTDTQYIEAIIRVGTTQQLYTRTGQNLSTPTTPPTPPPITAITGQPNTETATQLANYENTHNETTRHTLLKNATKKLQHEAEQLSNQLDSLDKQQNPQTHETAARKALITAQWNTTNDNRWILQSHTNQLKNCLNLTQNNTYGTLYHPNNWTYRCVSIIIGESNADPTGEKALLRGRSNNQKQTVELNYVATDTTNEMMNVMLHELTHVYAHTQWNPAQRQRYANHFQQKSFNTGNYDEMPTEKFANTYPQCPTGRPTLITNENPTTKPTNPKPDTELCNLAEHINNTPYRVF